MGAAAACTLANYVSESAWGHPWAPVTSGSVLAAGEPFYLNSFFPGKTPAGTGETSAFKAIPNAACGRSRQVRREFEILGCEPS